MNNSWNGEQEEIELNYCLKEDEIGQNFEVISVMLNHSHKPI